MAVLHLCHFALKNRVSLEEVAQRIRWVPWKVKPGVSGAWGWGASLLNCSTNSAGALPFGSY